MRFVYLVLGRWLLSPVNARVAPGPESAWLISFGAPLLEGAMPFVLDEDAARTYQPIAGHTTLLAELIRELTGKPQSAPIIMAQPYVITLNYTSFLPGRRAEWWLRRCVRIAGRKAGFRVRFV